MAVVTVPNTEQLLAMQAPPPTGSETSGGGFFLPEVAPRVVTESDQMG